MKPTLYTSLVTMRKEHNHNLYLPYLYQRPVLSSSRKLTKELLLHITLATEEMSQKSEGSRVQIDSMAATVPIDFHSAIGLSGTLGSFAS
jgi:hypothetical protein